jgi:hypothetical protein
MYIFGSAKVVIYTGDLIKRSSENGFNAQLTALITKE